jgi:transcriptional regulator with XRE-family HTH domain
MSEVYYWWYAYGYFDPGEGNFPCIGQVIRHYRNMRGTGKLELAHALECTVRYVEMLESDHNTTTPQLISRRALLAKTLQIPPILLGLSSLTLCDPNTKISISEVLPETDAFIVLIPGWIQ